MIYPIVPDNLFTEECEVKDVTFVGTISDQFPSPGIKNPVAIFANKVVLISRVVTVQISANKQTYVEAANGNPPSYEFGKRCEPDPNLLVNTPLRITLGTKEDMADHAKHEHSRTKRSTLGYFDDLETTHIRARHCAVWNPDIGPNGAWDTDGVTTVHADSSVANCYATKFGTFGLIAEIEDVPHNEDDPSWLMITKMVGHSLSIICLIVFIVTILTST